VGSGFVKSLAQPGGMVTGLSFQETDVSTKRLEIFKQTLPSVTRIAVLQHRRSGQQALTAILAAAQNLQFRIRVLEVQGATEFESAFRAARNGNAEAIKIMASAIFYAHRKELVDLTTKYRWPGIYENRSSSRREALCLTEPISTIYSVERRLTWTKFLRVPSCRLACRAADKI
jgi:putative ABC transport system substrate-binding protein